VGAPQGARFSADGTRAVLFNASVYWLWNVGARRATRSDVGHAGVVGALEFAHGGRTLASLAADGTVAVHRCDRDEVVWTLETPDRAWGMTLRFSADNRTLLASGPTATRRAAWDLDTGMPVPFPIALHEKAAAWALSPDETLLWWRVDGWGPEGGAQLVRRADGVVLWSSSGWGCSAAFGDDGAVVAVAEGGDMLAVFYWLRAREGFRPERVATPRKQGSWQGENPSELCLFCDDGTRSVAKAMGAEVVCDTRTGELLGTTPAWCVRHAFRSPDCLVGVENDGTVWVWEVPSFRVRARLSLRDLDDAPSAVAISSDGGLLAVGTEAGVLFLFAVEG
jgi:WD40 repeat protein